MLALGFNLGLGGGTVGAVIQAVTAIIRPVMSDLTEGETLSDVPSFAEMIALGNFAPADGVTGVTIDGVTVEYVGVADENAPSVAGVLTGYRAVVAYTQDGEAKTQVFNAGIRRVRYIDPVAAGGLDDLSLFVGGDPVVVDVASDFTGGGITYDLAPSSIDLPEGSLLSEAGQLTIDLSEAIATGAVIIRGTDPDGDFDDTAFGLTVTLPQISTDTAPVMGALIDGADVATEAGTDGTYSSNVPGETVSASVSYERANGEAFSGEVTTGDILRKRVDLTGSEGTTATVFSEAITVQILSQVLSVSAGEVSGLNMPLTLDVDGAPDVTYAIGDFALVGDGSTLVNKNIGAAGESRLQSSIAREEDWSSNSGGTLTNAADSVAGFLPGMDVFSSNDFGAARVFGNIGAPGNHVMQVAYRRGQGASASDTTGYILRDSDTANVTEFYITDGQLTVVSEDAGGVSLLAVQDYDGVILDVILWDALFAGDYQVRISPAAPNKSMRLYFAEVEVGIQPTSFIATERQLPVTRPAAIASGTIPAAQDGVFEVSLPENLDGMFSVLATSDGNPTVVADGPFSVNTVAVNNVAPTIDAAPTVSGTYVEGETITFTVGNASGTPTPDEEFTLYRDNDVLLDNVTLTGPNIYDHLLTAADVGLTLGFGHEATNSEGTVEEFSPATPVIAAAAPPAMPPEITAFTFDSISGNDVSFDLTVSEACEVDWVMTTSATAPTPAQVAAGTDNSDVAATASGTFTVAASGVITSTGVIPADLDDAFAFHLSAHDGSGNRSADVDSVTGVSVDTTASANAISSVTGSPTNTQVGTDEIYQFDADGSFVADADMTITYLMVGPGGGGGSGEDFRRGGGGAGGEVITGTFDAISGQTYNVTVGAPGAGGADGFAGEAGGQSGITGTNAPGNVDGGEGGGAHTSSGSVPGGSGRLGGGAGGGDSTAGTGTLFSGGGNGGSLSGGGGAGAGGAGGDAENSGDFTSGAGGIGVSSSITGTSVGYGGGGAGGTDTNSGATQDGGGLGGVQGGVSGTAGTLGGGGGGGGGIGSLGAAGGPGRVTIRFSV